MNKNFICLVLVAVVLALPSCQKAEEPATAREDTADEPSSTPKVYPYISLTTEAEIVGPTRHGKDVDKSAYYVRGRMLLNDPDGFYSDTPLVDAKLNIR